ncbi:hypothetical protein Tco_0847105 [Tanacetum coccineum]
MTSCNSIYFSNGDLDNSTSNVLIPLDSWTSGLLVYKLPLSGGLPKDKKNYKKSFKGNEVLQPKPSPNTKSSVRRLPKEVTKEKGPVKPKAAHVESNIPLDDPFVKEWFKQFDPDPLKEIRACDIAEKLVLTKTVDFMFKVNFLMLFANVMGTADTIKAIELEIQEQVIGKLDLHGAWTESKLDQTKGFFDVCDNVSRTRTSSVPLTDKKSFCSMIEEKISMISAEKIALEDILKRANVEFPNDEEVIELYEKYRRLFKESVVLEDFQAHIDDFDNNDNDGGGKNDDLHSDNVGKKKESKESAAKDVVNAKKMA